MVVYLSTQLPTALCNFGKLGSGSLPLAEATCLRSEVGQGRLWPAGGWHSRSTPSSGNTGAFRSLRATYRHSRLRRLRGMLSETEHAELLLADLVGRVDRLRLAEIGDRLGAAFQHFIGEAAVVIGLDIGRIELDRLRVI